jgi:hypothetical protein
MVKKKTEPIVEAKEAKAPTDPYAGETITPKPSNVVTVDGVDGHKHYAWRKDGVKPVIDLDEFRNNLHSALKGNPGADFADRVGPR